MTASISSALRTQVTPKSHNATGFEDDVTKQTSMGMEVERTAPSKLRQPTQYASPPRKIVPNGGGLQRCNSNTFQDENREPKLMRSISDVSDDSSDYASDSSSVFPLTMTPESTRGSFMKMASFSPQTKRTKAAKLRQQLETAEATVDAQAARIMELEDDVAFARADNAALRDILAAAHAQLDQRQAHVDHLTHETKTLQRQVQLVAEEARRAVLQHEKDWTIMYEKQRERIQQLVQANRALDGDLDDCHAALRAWQEQAAHADSRSRSMWQERLEMEYEMVRATAKSQQDAERQQRLDELKALQGMRAVSQSVFKEEGDEEVEVDVVPRRRAAHCIQDADESVEETAEWMMGAWIERQIRSHEEHLAWLETLEHHMEEDSRMYLDALHAAEGSSLDEDAADEEYTSNVLREIDVLLRRSGDVVSIEDTSSFCRIRNVEIKVAC
ncbi:Aste57867_12773 [Aphanomyces stellatus]|uniref:Aste57867_12773 protein n=1 Tax=Aphanomyces stellatus TaxID=120398 RepID=A0A485KYG2_9STRA|nr:hypothetical protein As57867_012725 [Aphanomyces stellatus]VFT89622.1 Aste57867_12773 [Aphanomyces stellatus]